MNTLLGNTTIKVWLKFSKKKYGLKKKKFLILIQNGTSYNTGFKIISF